MSRQITQSIGVPVGTGTSVERNSSSVPLDLAAIADADWKELRMRFRSTLRAFATGLAVAAMLAAPVAARADISVDAGGFATNGTAAAGAALSVGVFHIPLTPISTELTGAFPLGANGGYAATFDVRAGLFGTTLGAGAGVGTIGNKATTGVIYDAILAQSILPHISLEAREYLGPQRRSSFFGGVRFTI